MIPEFLWELFLAMYLTARGFRPSSLAGNHRTLTVGSGEFSGAAR
jgi:hypothetical protein